MEHEEKILLLKGLCSEEVSEVHHFYEVLDKCGILKSDYCKYMSTAPINSDDELLRLEGADYDLSCALITMLLREDYFDNGSFERRIAHGQVRPIIERIIDCLMGNKTKHIRSFSEKAIEALNGFYVYSLIDPRNGKVFYIGKGTGNRVFSHETESGKLLQSEKQKLKIIREIESSNHSVRRVIVNWGLSESEAFAAEAALINLLNYTETIQLSNAVAGHHTHEALAVEDFELMHGAIPLQKEDIKHSILVIKINKLYRRDMCEAELYDTVRGYWAASLKSIEARKVRYVFGVYNGLIVAVYKPDEWHYGHEMVDIPQKNILKPEDYDKIKNRVYFTCWDYRALDDEGQFYLNKTIDNLKVNQTAQNPISYLMPEKNNSEDAQ